MDEKMYVLTIWETSDSVLFAFARHAWFKHRCEEGGYEVEASYAEMLYEGTMKPEGLVSEKQPENGSAGGRQYAEITSLRLERPFERLGIAFQKVVNFRISPEVLEVAMGEIRSKIQAKERKLDFEKAIQKCPRRQG